jgi:CheY-like chemotaxis protein
MPEFFNILYADDNPGDLELASEALAEANIHCRLFSVRNGDEVLDFLHQRGRFNDATPRPDLILLDLNMPKTNGIDALKAIKGDTRFQAIPAVMFTSSAREDDIAAAYNAGANCYVEKPAHLDLFLRSVKAIVRYWMFVAE